MTRVSVKVMARSLARTRLPPRARTIIRFIVELARDRTSIGLSVV
jgi:hypothetical protein